jgi:hypothetical protein
MLDGVTAGTGPAGTVTGFVAILTRPTTAANVLAVAVVLLAWLAVRHLLAVTRPPAIDPVGDRRPEALPTGDLETPAVVGLLTNDHVVPRAAITATVLDLAARGWLRLASVDGELIVVVRGSGVDGDPLRPYEQQVLNHLGARAFEGVTSAATLAASRRRIDRRWRWRFSRAVVRDARSLGLTRRRFTPRRFLVPVVAVVLAVVVLRWAALGGDEGIALTESVVPRIVWVLAALTLLATVWQLLQLLVLPCESPTVLGLERQAQWLGYRSRLRDRIPDHASVVVAAPQQLALAHATVLGTADHVLAQVPVVREDDRHAWSEAGGRAHVVRIRYPFRPAYGRNPTVIAVVGALVLAGSVWARRGATQVADGEALQTWIDDVEAQRAWIEGTAEVLAVLTWIPTVWAVWALGAGVVDTILSRERVGAVVRVRRPRAVVPLPRLLGPLVERDRYSVYLAVDDGHRATVSAWLATERTAAPQGSQARVRATPFLGHVRDSRPVGTSTRRAVDTEGRPVDR